jgi:hypothetical protein
MLQNHSSYAYNIRTYVTATAAISTTLANSYVTKHKVALCYNIQQLAATAKQQLCYNTAAAQQHPAVIQHTVCYNIQQLCYNINSSHVTTLHSSYSFSQHAATIQDCQQL